MKNSYKNHIKFHWYAHSDDGSFEDKSARGFDTQEECYKDMMEHAVDKMKWNIEWEDLVPAAVSTTIDGVLVVGEPINYQMCVNTNRITHTSYSGTYRWEIERVVDEWKPRFKCNDIINIRNGNTVALVVCANECATDPKDFGYKILIYGQEIPKYNEWTKDKDHWISAEDEKNWSKIGEVTRDVEDGNA